MNTITREVISFEKLKDLKPLLAGTAPCLSVYMTLNANAKQNALTWKECLRTVSGKAEQFGTAGHELVQSVSDWQSFAPAPGESESKSVAVFKSADVFHVAFLDYPVATSAVMGPHFQIRALLPELVKQKSFYLLALSQKNTRILHCTATSSEEVPFPATVQTDFEAWMNQAKPDHNAVSNGVTAGTQGSERPHALAPKGADQDAKDEYLSHYFKQINRGVAELLKGKSEPLVLCAVEYEIALYRGVNSYSNLAQVDVKGAPNGLKLGEMHARAIDAVEQCAAMKLDEVLAEWNHRVGGGASSRLKEVVTAAHEGRVLTLLISESQEKVGLFDEETQQVKGKQTGSTADEDLVNDAAVQTILHAGNVLVAPQSKMPNGSAMAAIYRY